MEQQLNGFMPVLFVTGTYRTPRGRDDIAIDTRRYAQYLSRHLKAHVSVEIGIEPGVNSHWHMAVFSPDLTVTDAALLKMETKEAWGYGRIEARRWMDMSGRHYVLKHEVLHMAGEVFCPCQKRSCRKNRCAYQLRQRIGSRAER